MAGSLVSEIERSTAEARRRQTEDLQLSERNKKRYLSPPADTPYPLEYAYHLLGEIKGKRVLDFGCGAGENTAILALRGADVTALDISPDLVKLACKRVELNHLFARFEVASATDTKLADEAFDIVFGKSILHHLDVPAAGREVYRLLQPGGYAVFVEPVRESKLARCYREIVPVRGDEISPAEYPLRESDIINFHERLTLVDSRSFLLPHLKLSKKQWAWKVDSYLLKNYAGLRNFARVCVFKHAKISVN
jgi:SAM-dependent methyltransferase